MKPVLTLRKKFIAKLCVIVCNEGPKIVILNSGQEGYCMTAE